MSHTCPKDFVKRLSILEIGSFMNFSFLSRIIYCGIKDLPVTMSRKSYAPIYFVFVLFQFVLYTYLTPSWLVANLITFLPPILLFLAISLKRPIGSNRYYFAMFFVIHFFYSFIFIYLNKLLKSWESISSYKFRLFEIITLEEIQWSLLFFFLTYLVVYSASKQYLKEPIKNHKRSVGAFILLILHGLSGIGILVYFSIVNGSLKYNYLFLLTFFQLPVIILCIWLQNNYWRTLLYCLLLTLVPNMILEFKGFRNDYWQFPSDYLFHLFGIPIEEILCIVIFAPSSIAAAVLVFRNYLSHWVISRVG